MNPLNIMRINIVGMGKGRDKVPPGDTRWGLTRIIHHMPVDAIFNMHDVEKMEDENKHYFYDCLDKCIETETVLYSPNDVDYEKHVLYPLDMVIERFGVDYFSSSIDYALAYAIAAEPTEIHLYGINLVKKNKAEYEKQKPSAEFWIGMAMGLGIKVKTYGPSTLLKTHNGIIYGYETTQRGFIS